MLATGLPSVDVPFHPLQFCPPSWGPPVPIFFFSNFPPFVSYFSIGQRALTFFSRKSDFPRILLLGIWFFFRPPHPLFLKFTKGTHIPWKFSFCLLTMFVFYPLTILLRDASPTVRSLPFHCLPPDFPLGVFSESHGFGHFSFLK